ITGQHPLKTSARKAISGFGIRKGDIVGMMVTLRGEKMYDFVDRLINAVLPRIRDFRGISPKAFDRRGNLTIGIKEHTVFPEVEAENVEKIFGMEITIVTTATKDKEGRWISARQIEAARRAMTRFVQRGGKIWVRIFPDKPVTFKGVETAMGKGKGAVDHFVSVVKPGRILFEMDGVPEDTAREAMRLASHKLPIKTKFIVKESIKK
ncbi:unnamed protein product, partial [marine sediment metagenome]